MSTIIQTEEFTEVIDDIDDGRSLIVHNDDFNTFEHVIKTLIKVCGHEPHQAEQCTYIIHYSGKCAVKTGSFEILKPMREGIADAGIKATIK
ncbi:MAG: ATP-dependent Clp protease adaptor ClpS [Bacteroidetes bacterium]|nr:ATP-dependent Clp protease adaptor ClpS [Bacteroidota bacterium]MDA1120554.1 ATP-dependent Clp protease adaptor ClpS [Bacteroidota bacterium]